ncbi:MAG: DJ-1/PfpI family protein [Gammaproteobacteria bacterium]|nr:DJ-1/PfpI family protein [Gammaproteobacteria bacterium]
MNHNPRQKIVIIPIPNQDFDPTEVAVPWKVLTDLGYKVVFATPDGGSAAADAFMVTGEELDLWGKIPVLKKAKLVGLMLRADHRARSAYAALTKDSAFLTPLKYSDLRVEDYDGLLLPGGHRARGMRAFLESKTLQDFVGAFFDSGKPAAAICHGVVLAARSISPSTGKSVLYGRKTTALTWKMERTASRLMKFLGRVWDADYYRTYTEKQGDPVGYWSVQAEVTRALARPEDFQDVTPETPYFFRKDSGLFRDRVEDARASFIVEDGNYISARWPGDAHQFALAFAARLQAS